MAAMSMLDIRTLSLVALATSLLLPLVLLAGGQFVGSQHPSTRTLHRGVMLYASGFLCFALRGVTTDWVGIVLANVLIFAGYCELALGFRLYFRGRMDRRLEYTGIAALLGMLVWYTYIAPSPTTRIFYNSFFLGAVSFVMACEFFAASRKLRRTDDGARTERRLLDALCLTFVLTGASFVFRSYLFFGVHGDLDPSTLAGTSYGISFVIGVLLNFVMAASLPLLISRRNQQELIESRELLAETEDLALVGSLVYDVAAQTSRANRVLATMLGTPDLGAVTLQSWLNQLHPQDKPRVQEEIQEMLAGKRSTIQTECRLQQRPHDTLHWVSLRCAMRRNAADQIQFIASMRDITHIKTAAQAALAARDEADRANAAKSAFLANMSHEIRTPMNGVLGLTRLCLEGSLPPRERDLIEKCHSAAHTLLGVVNDILDFSKIEAGKLVVEHTAFDLGRTVNNARNLFEQMAGGKGLRFGVEIGPDVPMGLVGDPLRLSQVLNNLLGNAVKFTQQGEVRLSIQRLHAAPDTVQLAFTVQDSGIGMSAAQQQNLFQAFSQADASTTRKFGGTGLGLVICRHLTGLMGGTLTVRSEEGAGATFTATLPFGIARIALQSPAEAVPKGAQRLAGLRILLVEDNPTNVLVATLSLENEGATVVHRADGQQAVDYLRAQADDVDVVLMDIQMPVMDGYTATRILRTEMGLDSLPVVAMTANVMDADREASQRAGMNAHVGKPFEMDRLVTVILQSVGGAVVTPERSPSPPLPAPSEAARPPALVDLGPALQRMGNNRALVQQAAASLGQDLPGMFAALRAPHGEAPSPLPTLHTLKGLTATLGLARAAERARALEAASRSGAPVSAANLEALEVLVKDSLQALLAQLTDPGTAAVAAPGTAAPLENGTEPEVRAVLAQLAHLLAQSDLSALSHFTQHRRQLQVHDSARCAQLENALQALDFEAATRACRSILDAK